MEKEIKKLTEVKDSTIVKIGVEDETGAVLRPYAADIREIEELLKLKNDSKNSVKFNRVSVKNFKSVLKSRTDINDVQKKIIIKNIE